MCIRIILLFCLLLPALKAGAADVFDFILTDNKDLERKMFFLDRLYDCEAHKYHALPSGLYEIYGKQQNGACFVRWTVVDCMFPRGVYQEFAKVQKYRTIERQLRRDAGLREELKDRNYRYLLKTGNEYCINRYPYYY